MSAGRIPAATALVVGLAAVLAPVARAADPEIKMFSVSIRDGKVSAAHRVLKARHQDQVRIEWSVDRPLVVHLEGYDVTVEARPGSPAIMEFPAYATGRYPAHAHDVDTQGPPSGHRHGRDALLRLEVHPR